MNFKEGQRGPVMFIHIDKFTATNSPTVQIVAALEKCGRAPTGFYPLNPAGLSSEQQLGTNKTVAVRDCNGCGTAVHLRSMFVG